MILAAAHKLHSNKVAEYATMVLTQGYETMSATIAFCLFELAKNPEVQSKLAEELTNFELSDCDVVTALPYLDMCLKGKSFWIWQRVFKRSWFTNPNMRVLIQKSQSLSMLMTPNTVSWVRNGHLWVIDSVQKRKADWKTHSLGGFELVILEQKIRQSDIF